MNDDRLTALWLQGRCPNTTARYRRDLAALRTFLRGKPLAEATLEDLQDFAATLQRRNLSPASQNTTLQAVKSLFKTAAWLGAIQNNPALGLRTPKVPDTLAGRILSQEEVGRLLRAARSLCPRGRAAERFRNRHYRTYVALLTLYATGCRASELLSITWSDLRPTDDGGANVNIVGKGQKSRILILPPLVRAAIEKLRPPGAGRHTAIFRSYPRHRENRPWQRENLFRDLRHVAHVAGLAVEISPHWLRHSHATHSLQRGCPVHVLRDTLGHSSLLTTGKYLHAAAGETSGRFLDLAGLLEREGPALGRRQGWPGL